jgi:hypothetical protein
MSQILTLELSDHAFTAILQEAAIAGLPPEHLLATLIERQFGQAFARLRGETEKETARAKFERHFGTLCPDATLTVDNESIDADLAREYASNHGDA